MTKKRMRSIAMVTNSAYQAKVLAPSNRIVLSVAAGLALSTTHHYVRPFSDCSYHGLFALGACALRGVPDQRSRRNSKGGSLSELQWA